VADAGPYRFEPLTRQHNRNGFECDSPELTEYLRTKARNHADRKIAVAYVMVAEAAPQEILGFYTLSNFSIGLSALPENLREKLPRYDELPATLIGRLARAKTAPGVGKLLLVDALKRSLANTAACASMAVVADAKDQRAMDFYVKYGFREIENAGDRFPRRVFIPMRSVEDLFAQPPS
jgi:ribosomal protein S18 acetylase RimI-like enzyme